MGMKMSFQTSCGCRQTENSLTFVWILGEPAQSRGQSEKPTWFRVTAVTGAGATVTAAAGAERGAAAFAERRLAAVAGDFNLNTKTIQQKTF